MHIPSAYFLAAESAEIRGIYLGKVYISNLKFRVVPRLPRLI